MRKRAGARVKKNRLPNKKRRRRSIIAFDMIRLDRSSAEPLHQQLYRQIRDELVLGRFDRSTSRLPSTRALAADLGISRLTVNLAFEKLHEEGYLRSKIGSGTFVALLQKLGFTLADISSATLTFSAPRHVRDDYTLPCRSELVTADGKRYEHQMA
jgi:DNA-binding transcriptional regulator YhcF (GntR family)